MPTIRVLLPGLVNQIAAGEVVERPAAVVKELLENALDAQARSVQIEVEGGGLSAIRVIDDGLGMSREDALLCLERHATSKLHDLEGLSSIRTLGFRGEALPSIASVSRLRIDTQPADGTPGTRLTLEGGENLRISELARSRGTTVEVKDLFFNTPARRKFVRSVSTESAHASEAVVRLMLAHTQVGFTLRSNGRTLFAFGAEATDSGDRHELRERIASAIGREVFPHLLPVSSLPSSEAGIAVTGLFAGPAFSVATARAIYLFINGRYVRDRGLQYALLRAFAETLPSGRFPAAVLHLSIPPKLVDVNVHPQKLEVRFADPRRVQEVLVRAVSEVLRGTPWLRHRPPDELEGLPIPRVSDGGTTAAFWPSARRPNDDQSFKHDEQVRTGLVLAEAHQSHQPIVSSSGENGYFSSLRYIGRHGRTYLLCEGEGESLVVIDQHASHERVLFHQLRQAHRERGLVVQPLLLPQVIHLPPAVAQNLESHLPKLKELGVELEPFGGDAVAVKGLPALLTGVEVAPLLTDLSNQLANESQGTPALDQVVHLLLATMACHSAVRAGDVLAEAEALALLRSLDAVDFRAHCPHGRPVVFELHRTELERRVGRI